MISNKGGRCHLIPAPHSCWEIVAGLRSAQRVGGGGEEKRKRRVDMHLYEIYVIYMTYTHDLYILHIYDVYRYIT